MCVGLIITVGNGTTQTGYGTIPVGCRDGSRYVNGFMVLWFYGFMVFCFFGFVVHGFKILRFDDFWFLAFGFMALWLCGCMFYGFIVFSLCGVRF